MLHILIKSHYWRNPIQQKFRRENVHLLQTPLELWHTGTSGSLFSASSFSNSIFPLFSQGSRQALRHSCASRSKESSPPSSELQKQSCKDISSSQRLSWWTWALPAQHDVCNSKGKTWWGTDKERNSSNGIIPILYLHYLTVHNLFRMKPTILSADVLSWLQWHTLH